MIWPFKRKLDPVAERYLAACRERVGREVDVADLRVVALDAETTGFSVSADRVLSLASIEVRHREIRVGTARSWLVYQESSPVNEAMTVHGILPSQTANGQPEREVMGELLGTLGGSLVVGHHIGFDVAMLGAATRRHFGIGFKNRILDTALLAMQELSAFHRTGYANQPPPSLEDVCSALDVPMMDRHTATGDAFTTAVVFLTLCARLRRRLGRPVRCRDLPLRRD